MDANLRPIYERVMQAIRPEDAFKELTVVLPPRLLAGHLEPEMAEMRQVLDEGSYSSFDDQQAAATARARLEQLYTDALAQAAHGLYVLDDRTVSALPSGGRRITVGGLECSVGETLHEGDHSTVYRGRVRTAYGSGGVVFKVAKGPEHNPYLFNEIRMLDLLHRSEVGFWRNVPFMLGRFTAGNRVGIVERLFDGYTLREVRANALHRDGLDQRHMVWVLDRVLGVLGYAHKLGIIHGGISPDRIRVRPSNHNAMLTGWGYSVYRPSITDECVPPTGGPFEAPEVGRGGTLGPWTDIYSLGKTLIWLLGGDPETNEVPETVEPILRRFLLNMVRKSPQARPNDAWQLYDAQNRIKDTLWPRQFVHLNMA